MTDIASANSSLPIIFVCQDAHKSHSPGIFYGQSPVNYSFTLMMLQLILLVSITLVIRFLLKPLKQPKFVSSILGGIVVGPSVLGQNKTFSKFIIPANTHYLIQTLGALAFVYYLFVTGVKMDAAQVRKARKKQISLSVVGFILPFVTGVVIFYSIRKFLPQFLTRPPIIGMVLCTLSISTFPTIEQIIKELNLVSSEVGRLALSTSIITDCVSIICVILFEAFRHYLINPLDTLWIILSAFLIFGFVFGCKQAMVWIVNTLPDGKPVPEACAVTILVGALILSFLTDVVGINLAIGPHLLGLVVPSGPPLGSIVVDRIETILKEFLMPFGFILFGVGTDLTSISLKWNDYWPIFVLAVGVCVAKFLTIFMMSRFHGMPMKDGLALSFIMGMRGEVEFVLYVHWLSLGVVTIPTYSSLVLTSTLITAISTPMVTILYDPTRPYMVNKRRAIQFTAADTELKIVACIYDQESVAGFINLLEVSNLTASCPLTIFSLRLIELVGRGAAVFVDHENQAEAFELTGYNRIHNALTTFQESIGECVRFHHFTSVSATRTMYQDICKLALTEKTAIIILPFRTESLGGRTEVVHHGVLHSVNSNVLSHAPCSVGILVDRAGPFHNHHVNYTKRNLSHHFVVLFLGGADAREALTFADRMTLNPNVSLTVIRFLSYNGLGDDPIEKKLDDGLVTWFWVKNEGKEGVVYKEAVVSDGSETMVAIQEMTSNCFFDLWIVGRKSGINQVLIQGLSNWSNKNELGVVGDYITSVDLTMNASVLVVQQQVLRGQEDGNSGGLLGKTSCCK